MPSCFTDFDLSGFWEKSDYASKTYVLPPPTDAGVASIEAELGYKLPASYVALMRTQNGGIPVNTCFPTNAPTSWAEDHVAISGFLGIGGKKSYSLCGDLGSQFHIDVWGYPPIGIYFGDCPSAGHDLIALDYRACGPQGEPQVVHVDQEGDYRITFLAENFEAFVRGLVPEDVYAEDPEAVKFAALERVQSVPFGKLLQTLCDAFPDTHMPATIRRLAGAIVQDKGHFSLHADALSHMMYDLQFVLYSHSRTIKSCEGYIQSYPHMIAMTLGSEFGTGGWAQDFVRDWWHIRQQAGQIVQTENGWRFAPDFAAMLNQRLAAYQ